MGTLSVPFCVRIGGDLDVIVRWTRLGLDELSVLVYPR